MLRRREYHESDTLTSSRVVLIWIDQSTREGVVYNCWYGYRALDGGPIRWYGPLLSSCSSWTDSRRLVDLDTCSAFDYDENTYIRRAQTSQTVVEPDFVRIYHPQTHEHKILPIAWIETPSLETPRSSNDSLRISMASSKSTMHNMTGSARQSTCRSSRSCPAWSGEYNPRTPAENESAGGSGTQSPSGTTSGSCTPRPMDEAWKCELCFQRRLPLLALTNVSRSNADAAMGSDAHYHSIRAIERQEARQEQYPGRGDVTDIPFNYFPRMLDGKLPTAKIWELLSQIREVNRRAGDDAGGR